MGKFDALKQNQFNRELGKVVLIFFLSKTYQIIMEI